MATRELLDTVFNQIPDTAREEAYESAKRMTAELRHQNLVGSAEIEVERVNPRTYKIWLVKD